VRVNLRLSRRKSRLKRGLSRFVPGMLAILASRKRSPRRDWFIRSITSRVEEIESLGMLQSLNEGAMAREGESCQDLLPRFSNWRRAREAPRPSGTSGHFKHRSMFDASLSAG